MVEYLEIKGKKYPVRIGYYVMKAVKAESDMSLGDALQKADENPEVHEIILWAALKQGAWAEDTELDLKREDIPMLLDLVFYDYLELYASEKFFPKDLVEKTEQRLGNLNKKTEAKKKK